MYYKDGRTPIGELTDEERARIQKVVHISKCSDLKEAHLKSQRQRHGGYGYMRKEKALKITAVRDPYGIGVRVLTQSKLPKSRL